MTDTAGADASVNVSKIHNTIAIANIISLTTRMYSYLSLKPVSMSSPSGSISPTPRDTPAGLVALNERLSTLEQACMAAAQQTH